MNPLRATISFLKARPSIPLLVIGTTVATLTAKRSVEVTPTGKIYKMVWGDRSLTVTTTDVTKEEELMREATLKKSE